MMLFSAFGVAFAARFELSLAEEARPTNAFSNIGVGLCAPSTKSWFPRWIGFDLSSQQCDFVCANALECEALNYIAAGGACKSACIIHLNKAMPAPAGWTARDGKLGFLHSVVTRPMADTECLAKVPPTKAGGLCTVNAERACAMDKDCVPNARCSNGRCLCSRGCFHEREKLCLPWSDVRWRPEKKLPQKTTSTTTTPPPEVAPAPAPAPAAPVCNLGKTLQSVGIM